MVPYLVVKINWNIIATFTQSSEHAIFVIYQDAHQSGSMHRQSHQVSVFLNLHTNIRVRLMLWYQATWNV